MIPHLKTMATNLLYILVLVLSSRRTMPAFAQVTPSVTLKVNANDPGREIPPYLFGLFFEEINHAGSGGLWAELVQNRGFEAGGQNTPSIFDPWYKIGTEAEVTIGTDRSSPFERNPVALKIEVLCDNDDARKKCPTGGVGAANPGFWGMNVLAGSKYRVEFWLRSTSTFSLSVSFISADGKLVLAQEHLRVKDHINKDWSKQSVVLTPTSTDHNARLALTSGMKGVFWVDQVSAMPTDTFKGHGFRKELAQMISDLKPGFLRFLGVAMWRAHGCQMHSVGGTLSVLTRIVLGITETCGITGVTMVSVTMKLAEDLGAVPIWVFNNGISHEQSVPTDVIGPFVQDVLDGIEFARGPADSKWGAVRAQMGHPEPFHLHHLAIGNEDCWKPYYKGNYMAFYTAIKLMYPDMQLISNCDGSGAPLDHPADLYDFHVYTNANNLFAMRHQFDRTSRSGAKAFVSEYAVTGSDSGRGSLLAALAEGAFLVGIELNSDVVHMASYAPLFVNDNDRRWNPDAIVFNSWQEYGTPSYWVQHFFKDSNGGHLVPSMVQADSSTSLSSLITSVVRAHKSSNGLDYLIVKAVNFGGTSMNLSLAVTGLTTKNVVASESYITVMTSAALMDENSFINPAKVVPQVSKVTNAGPNMRLSLPAYSILALELGLTPGKTIMSTAEVVQVAEAERNVYSS